MHTGRPNGENSERMLAYADALTQHKSRYGYVPIHSSVKVAPGFLLLVCFFFPGVCVRPSMDWWCVTTIVDRLHPATSGVSDEKKNGWPRNLSDNYYELQGDCELHDITMRIHPNELGSRVAEMGGKPKRRVARTPNSDFFFQLQTKSDRFCPLALHGPSPAARLSGAL